MFYSDIDIILSDIVLNIFFYPREVKVIRKLFKHLLNPLITIRVFYFIIYLEDLSSSTYRDIYLFLES